MMRSGAITLGIVFFVRIICTNLKDSSRMQISYMIQLVAVSQSHSTARVIHLPLSIHMHPLQQKSRKYSRIEVGKCSAQNGVYFSLRTLWLHGQLVWVSGYHGGTAPPALAVKLSSGQTSTLSTSRVSVS